MQWYEAEVRALIDRVSATTVGATRPPVFYGSSSFRLWDTLAEDVSPSVLNLGFGGSTLEACDFFFDRLVPPVQPRSILLYAGDNDLGDGRSVDAVFASYQSVCHKVTRTLGFIPLGFLSVKPSPARFGIIDRIRHLNALVKADIETRPAGYYVDAFSSMLDASGRPDQTLFEADCLHMNRAGYRLWSELLRPYHNRIFNE